MRYENKIAWQQTNRVRGETKYNNIEETERQDKLVVSEDRSGSERCVLVWSVIVFRPYV